MMGLTRRLGVILVFLSAGLTSHAADNSPQPGRMFGTPVEESFLDAGAYCMWENGKESPVGKGANGPAWVLWTKSDRTPGHSGVSFGASKVEGPRHLRIGFKQAVPVGTVMTKGNVSVSVLKPAAAYPGDLSSDELWTAGQRWFKGRITGVQAGEDEIALWVFPPDTVTRALRFTHVPARTDPNYSGSLGTAIVLQRRFVNLAPAATATAESNDRFASRLINGTSETWNCWDNMSVGDDKAADRPVVSTRDPECIQLTWQEPVKLDGLIAVWAGFGAADVQTYVGPADVHPRDAGDSAWKTVSTLSSLESGYPCPLWPNYFRFRSQVETRAVRLRITKSTPPRHPHLKGKVVDGKRVWLGELLAVEDIGTAAMPEPAVAVARAGAPHPPIPVRFALPEPGFVTLVIEDAKGMRVRNLVSETHFEAGENTAWWDGTDDLGRDVDAAAHGLYNIPARFVAPGSYSVRGLWHKGIEAFYEFPVYSAGAPPWSTPDHTGGWLANHSPPQAAVFIPGHRSPTGAPCVMLGSYVTEGPDGLAWVDLEGRKRGGMKWIGGNWTAAPYLGTDTGPSADPQTTAYVASVWSTEKKSTEMELRITALTKAEDHGLSSRIVLRETLDRLGSSGEVGRGERGQSVAGVAAFNGVVACSMPALRKVLFIDGAKGGILGALALEQSRGLTYDGAGRLFVLAGQRLLRYDGASALKTTDTPLVLVSTGLEAPFGIALDSAGNLYVSDQGESHQVKVFSPEGRPIRTIGLRGRPGEGPYDPLHMNHPAGLAVDSNNRLWVAENDYLPKRVSVWSLDGKLVNAFYGPGKYGGGGTLDSHDPTRFYYADEGRGTMEFRLDWDRGRAELAAVLYRQTPESLRMPFRTAAPETALYREGRRYFTNCYNTNPTSGHSSAFLYIERTGVVRPVAGMGRAMEWDLLKTQPFRPVWPAGTDPTPEKRPSKTTDQTFFIWSDTNGDALVQPAEVSIQPATARGVTVMEDLSFCIANADGKTLRLVPTGFTAAGVPSYDFSKARVLAEGVRQAASSGGCQALADESNETVITLGVTPFHSHSVSGTRDGKAVWSYPSLWPGLHASHHAAKPDRPGELIGTTRLLGGFVRPRGSQVEPLWAVNGNMGNLYLFTRDGLFVSTVFKDVCQGTLWRMPVAERGMSLKGLTLHDENFWPSISQTPEGQVYLVDGSHTCLVRLDGLDTLRPIPAMSVEVTAQQLEESQRYVVEKETFRQKVFGSGVLKAAILPTTPVVDGKADEWKGADWVEIDRRGAGANFNSTAKPYDIRGALAAAGDRLYAVWDTNEPALLRNSGEVPHALFKTGGALDLMLGCNPSAPKDRVEPVPGDLRLLVTQVKGKTRATLYRAVVPGTPDDARVPFSSPWRTVSFDQVTDVSDQVVLKSDGKGLYEVSVPLALLGLTPTPGMRIRGDMGILRGSGTETTARSYWSNKATAITADVPSEAMLTPYLWGPIEWRAASNAGPAAK